MIQNVREGSLFSVDIKIDLISLDIALNMFYNKIL